MSQYHYHFESVHSVRSEASLLVYEGEIVLQVDRIRFRGIEVGMG